jgi:hypothetical protein
MRSRFFGRSNGLRRPGDGLHGSHVCFVRRVLAVLGALGRGLNVPGGRLLSNACHQSQPRSRQSVWRYGACSARVEGHCAGGVWFDGLTTNGKRDMDRSYLRRLERGEKQPSLDVVFRVAAALEIEAHKLVARVAKAAA